MRMNVKLSLSRCLYIVGATILFFLAVVCMISFIKAVCVKGEIAEKPQKIFADSLQVEQLRLDVYMLKAKVDSLIIISQQEPKVKYKYLKSRKDSCVIELNVNKMTVNKE